MVPMVPVEQTVFGPRHGNCFAACLASILELPIDQVPDFITTFEGHTWLPMLLDWLNKFGLSAVFLAYSSEVNAPSGYAILSAWNLRSNCKHAVVVKDGAIVWDPSPNRADGLGEPEHWMAFTVLDPSKLVANGLRKMVLVPVP